MKLEFDDSNRWKMGLKLHKPEFRFYYVAHLNGLDEDGICTSAFWVRKFQYPAGRRPDEDNVVGRPVDRPDAGVDPDDAQPLGHARLDEERALLPRRLHRPVHQRVPLHEVHAGFAQRRVVVARLCPCRRRRPSSSSGVTFSRTRVGRMSPVERQPVRVDRFLFGRK